MDSTGPLSLGDIEAGESRCLVTFLQGHPGVCPALGSLTALLQHCIAGRCAPREAGDGADGYGPGFRERSHLVIFKIEIFGSLAVKDH